MPHRRVLVFSLFALYKLAVKTSHMKAQSIGVAEILLIEGHPVVHRTLSEIVRLAVPGAVVHVETTLAAGLARAARLRAPRLVLLDLGLPDSEGIETLQQFRHAGRSDVPIVVISASDDPQAIHAAFKCGAAGYLPKTSPAETMIAALKSVVSGGVYMPPSLILPVQEAIARPDLRLTRRQIEILNLVSDGMSNRGIAKILEISEGTVKQHLYSAFKALGVGTRTEAVLELVRRGIEPPSPLPIGSA